MRLFTVIANCDVDERVEAGDVVFIDRDASPAAGQLVLVGRRLEPWQYQDGIEGVAVRVERSL